ncbi:MAG: JAB domain-containing protein [bacterium]
MQIRPSNALLTTFKERGMLGSMGNEETGIEYTAEKALPAEECPRERLVRLGAGSLSTIELLAILLKGNVDESQALDAASELLKQFDGIRGLASGSLNEIADISLIGQDRAVMVLAALELGRRVSLAGIGERKEIHGPEDVFAILSGTLRDEKREHFYALLMNTKNFVMRISPISIGTLDMSLVSPRELFREAIREGAAGVIAAHNHPSGDA